MRGGATEVNETQKWATSKKKIENHWSRSPICLCFAPHDDRFAVETIVYVIININKVKGKAIPVTGREGP
jgi:hypothetical protein